MPGGTYNVGSLSLSKLLKGIFGSAFSYVRGYSSAPGGHHGIDISAATGTPIKAVTTGTVLYARNEGTDPNAPGYSRGGGNIVIVDIGNGYTESYAHLSAITVSAGQKIKPGEIVGKVGMTGGPSKYYPNIDSPTGPHLHFAVWNTNSKQFVDPLPYLKSGAAMLGAWGDLVSFPDGHTLTSADVDSIMRKLTDAGYFSGIGGEQARATTQQILTANVGQVWNKALQDKLQSEFGTAADAATDNPAQAIADALGGLVAFFATILNPANWIRILALLAGAAMTAFGAVSIMRASA